MLVTDQFELNNYYIAHIITDSVVLWKIQKFDWLLPETKWYSCLHNRALCSYLAALRLLRQRENNQRFRGHTSIAMSVIISYALLCIVMRLISDVHLRNEGFFLRSLEMNLDEARDKSREPRSGYRKICHCLTQVHFPWMQENKTLIPYIYNIFQRKTFFLKAPEKKVWNSLLNRLAMTSFQ